MYSSSVGAGFSGLINAFTSSAKKTANGASPLLVGEGFQHVSNEVSAHFGRPMADGFEVAVILGGLDHAHCWAPRGSTDPKSAA
jgi:hypothetical protein